MRGSNGERAKSADDSLGRVRAQGHPAATRVAEPRRMGNEKGGIHCWIVNAEPGLPKG